MNESDDKREPVGEFLVGIPGTIVRLLGKLPQEKKTGVRWIQNQLRAFLVGSRATEARDQCSGDDEVLAKLEQLLKEGESASQRGWAAAFISKFMDPKKAAVTLRDAVRLHEDAEMLDAKNWTLRYLGDVLWLLDRGSDGYKRGVGFLLGRLEVEEANDTRKYIIEALGAQASRLALPALIDIVDRDYMSVRVSAAYAMGQIADRRGPQLRDDGTFWSGSGEDREWHLAVEALGKVARAGEERSGDQVTADSNKSANGRREHTQERGKASYQDRDRDLAIAAIEALSSIGGRTSFRHLLAVLTEQDDHLMRARVSVAIVNIRDFWETIRGPKRYKWKKDSNLLIVSAIKDLKRLLDRLGLEHHLLWCLEMLIRKLPDDDDQAKCLIDLIFEADQRELPKLARLARRMHYERIREDLINREKEAMNTIASEGGRRDIEEEARIKRRASEAVIEMGGPALVDSVRIQRDLIDPIRQSALSASRLLVRSERNLQWSFRIILGSNVLLMITGFVLLALAIVSALSSRESSDSILFGSGAFASMMLTVVTYFVRRPGQDVQNASAQALKIQVPFMYYVQTFSESLLHFQDKFRRGQLTLEDIKSIDSIVGTAANNALAQISAKGSQVQGNVTGDATETIQSSHTAFRKSRSEPGGEGDKEENIP